MTYREIAEREIPPGICVTYRRSLSGAANSVERRLSAPEPTTRRRLYVFLHEVGHIVLQHRRTKHSYIEEFEAEMWAHQTMRKYGVPVSRRDTIQAKKYVAQKLRQGLKRGLKTADQRIVKWLGEHAPPMIMLPETQRRGTARRQRNP